MAGVKPLFTILFIIAIVVALVYFIMLHDATSAGVCTLFSISFLMARAQAPD